MNIAHLTEEQLQTLADSTDGTASLEMDHISTCAICRIKFENYQSINLAIQELPITTFDPDLPDDIVNMLIPQKIPIHWAALVAATLGGILVTVSAVIYGKQFVVLFIQLPTIMRYLFAILPLSFICMQSILYLIRYRQKLNMIIKKQIILQPKSDLWI
ncbi:MULTISPECIES: hypothetical protein [Sphingobacterium]|uniref:hypothetical protein n=1 Tax=Sphingobacterium TaxID=28453 RepID=UPI00257DBCCE|nr:MULTISPECIES: hypothetical protein [Sphingobacterium]